MEIIAVRLLAGVVWVYQKVGSPFLHALSGTIQGCRYYPTCSDYFLLSIQHNGIMNGSLSSLRRIGSCRPGGGGGYDPVCLGCRKKARKSK